MVFFYAKNMKSKLLYLKEKDFISTAYFFDYQQDIYSLKSYINHLVKKHLFNLPEYNRLARKEMNLKNKIPIYFSPDLLLFKINSQEGSYYINYFNVLKFCYEDKNVVIIFKNYDILKLTVSKIILSKELKKIDVVLTYISSL